MPDIVMNREVLALSAQVQIWALGTSQFPEWENGVPEYSLTDEAMAIAADVSDGDFVRVKVMRAQTSRSKLPHRMGKFALRGADLYCIGNFLAEDYETVAAVDGQFTFDLFVDNLGMTGSKAVDIVLP